MFLWAVNTRTRYILLLVLDCIKMGIAGFFFSLVFVLLNWDKDFAYHLLDGFLIGAFAGFWEFTFFRKEIKRWSFPALFITRSIFYAILVVFTIIFVELIIIKDPWDEILYDLTLPGTLQIAGQSFLLCMFIAVHLQIETLIGRGILGKFLIGKYHRPSVEKRIFMFLDMRNSTAITEKLGDKKYYEFLNMFFEDMSRPIFETKAEIYKYIGDEVVLTWKKNKGLKNNNCIRVFHLIQDRIQNNRMRYIRKFGVIPEFKAGVHFGTVVSAQIGDLKKEIAYNGDVLNTTARIQNLCNKYNADILASKALFDKLENNREYIFEDLGNIKLKGKENHVHLFKIERFKIKNVQKTISIRNVIDKVIPKKE